ERATRGAASSLHVGRRVAKRAIEPRDQRFFIARRRALLEIARERFLKDVLGERFVAEPSLQEAQERAVIRDERLSCSGILHSGTLFRSTCSSSSCTSHTCIVRSSSGS